MIEVIAEGLFTLVGEIVLQVIAELLFNLGIETVAHTLKRRKRANPFIAGVGFIIFGSITGLIISSLLPERIVPRINLHGLSIPLAAAGRSSPFLPVKAQRHNPHLS